MAHPFFQICESEMNFLCVTFEQFLFPCRKLASHLLFENMNPALRVQIMTCTFEVYPSAVVKSHYENVKNQHNFPLKKSNGLKLCGPVFVKFSFFKEV